MLTKLDLFLYGQNKNQNNQMAGRCRKVKVCLLQNKGDLHAL